MEREERIARGERAEEEYELRNYVVGSAKFDEYYSKQFASLMDKDEFSQFRSTLQEKLPVTFRLNPVLYGHSALVDMFCDEKLIESMAVEQESKDE